MGARLILQDQAGISKDDAKPRGVAGILARLTLSIYRLPSAIQSKVEILKCLVELLKC